jgi:uncharacterized repeat protein (TIGR03803 family)
MPRTVSSKTSIAYIISLVLACSVAASAATETIAHAFNRTPNGANPRAGLISDAAGNLYGTTMKGQSFGVVFKLSRNKQAQWVETVLYSFKGGYYGPDGSTPAGGVIFDSAGNLYGTTSYGGTSDCGTVYKLSPTASGPWKETILHNFACYPSDGAYPTGGLIFDSAGNLYGVTGEGGSGDCNDDQGDPPFGCGTAYELSPAAGGAYSETILYDFTTGNVYESYPSGSLAFDKSGNLYGTAAQGGSGEYCYYYGCGTVFELTHSSSGWTESTIYSLTGLDDGDTPISGVVFDTAGNMYVTGSGGYGYGGLFELSPSGSSWTETTLYTFSSSLYGPQGAVVLDSAGNVYGTAFGGGNLTDCNKGGCGAVYEVSPGSSGWTESTIYEFTGGSDGASPDATLLRESSGALFTTTYNGANGAGSVFELASVSGRWKGTTLYDFPDLTEGTNPYGGLLADGQGNYYGTTTSGGTNIPCSYYTGCGTVFKLTPSGSGWTETVLYSFTGTNGDGSYPTGNLVLDSEGNLYGTTQYGGITNYCLGGSNQCGVAYKLSPNGNGTWTETVIHQFAGGTTDGGNPAYGMVIDSSGNLYGTTGAGGANGLGTAFELSPSTGGTWTETLLHSFGGPPDVAPPTSGLTFDKSGNLYGVGGNGEYSAGGVYRLSPSGGSWTESVLFSFSFSNLSGYNPAGNLVFDGEGNLYGVTINGGSYGVGLAYKLTSAISGTWTESIVYNFRGVDGDGAYPNAGLTFDSEGNLYGTTLYGGVFGGPCSTLGCGAVFELTPSGATWHEHALHLFAGGNDGSNPQAPVVVDSAGDVWGTTANGGIGGSGIVFEIKE